MKTTKRLTLFSLVFLVAACASFRPTDKTVQQALVEDLVLQVRLALTALSRRYDPENSDLPLQLKLLAAKVKVSTSFETTSTGNINLIVSGTASNKSTDSNYIELTMSPPMNNADNIVLDSNVAGLLPFDNQSFYNTSVTTITSTPIRAATLDDLNCTENATRIIGSGNKPQYFWVDVVDLTAAAADGYLCAGLGSGGLPVSLDQLQVNVSFNATGSGNAGFEFEIGTIKIGSTRSVSASSGNSITITFETVD